jgi:hypothetical protein
MLKIKAYAVAQPVALNRRTGEELKDGWNLPRQTIYIKDSNYRRLDTQSYDDIAKYQNKFFSRIEEVINADPLWATANGWDKLPKIYNDPVRYSATSLIKDTKNHYTNRHDPTLSMLLRQKYLIRKLAKDLGNNTIIQMWDIDITFKNPTDPVLKKFYDKNVFSAVAVTNNYSELFGA